MNIEKLQKEFNKRKRNKRGSESWGTWFAIPPSSNFTSGTSGKNIKGMVKKCPKVGKMKGSI